ncbi:MAG: deoxyribodipyrimidine photo-lyase [Melioribacteraceae bacterium]|nr:deoxyribodipyrimidine photo-lyase [Melioribacteraceae bacterium]MCF8355780.1 deoxyribodipyrimidine photo-lyase [Melioribacteraceae bacterium]MCF8392830.1 deoxyribodipyrimidine photo-lyase [Melioribacteraceae bacterium]MCF8418684.1 deoxyribodipyrimidine photo-lyase [Melioribacteraceae bacterium]
MNPNRIRILQNGIEKSGPVIYWMQRDQRVNDNWALIYSLKKARENNTPLIVVFNLVDNFLEATFRQYDFMLKGLKEVEASLHEKNIPFYLLTGLPEINIPKLIDETAAGLLVSDFNPLKIVRSWKRDVAKKINIPFHEVDAHNVVPCLFVSGKEEFAAYTIRPKITRLLNEFLDDFPSIEKQNHLSKQLQKNDWQKVYEQLRINFDVRKIDWLIPGEFQAHNQLAFFIESKIEKYNEERNDPTKDAISNMSPYLHFGQISAQRIAIEIQKFNGNEESKNSFLEELIVRRELADNFCYFNNNYDSFEGFRNWAKGTLNNHLKDEREYLYNLDEFENASTHDPLWNAAQNEMRVKGKMHGYMRMYWAKKILDWSISPGKALQIANHLNDKYELDGRDPNGYTGTAWSIGGIHDRAWAERPVFGKIRYMNYNGCKRKFDVDKYISINS